MTFRAVYVPLILSGDKVTTIRRPSNRLPGQGEAFRLVNRYDRPPFAVATCLSVRDVLPEQLTSSDASADGFASLAELLEALERYCRDGPDAVPALLPEPVRIISFALDSPPSIP